MRGSSVFDPLCSNRGSAMVMSVSLENAHLCRKDAVSSNVAKAGLDFCLSEHQKRLHKVVNTACQCCAFFVVIAVSHIVHVPEKKIKIVSGMCL